ncbi:unnamed protein product [Ixodes hexagonus]
MRPDEVCQAVDIWKEQGLGQGVNNVKNFFLVDPDGFFVAVDKRTGDLLTFLATTTKPPSCFQFAVSAARSRRRTVTAGALGGSFPVGVKRLGDRTVYLRECATSLWKKRIGAQGAKLFPWKSRHISFFTRSYLCNAVSYPAILYPAQVMPFSTTTAEKVIAYDSLIHGYDREKIIRLTMNDVDGTSRAVVRRQNGEDAVCGFGKVNRNNPEGAVASPIYAQDRQVAGVLLRNLVENRPEARVNVTMFVPGCNQGACSLAEDLGLTEYIRLPRCFRMIGVAIRLELIYAQHDTNFCVA